MIPLVRRFIETFRRAIDGEMEALREARGPFEVPLLRGTLLARTEDGFELRFELSRFEEKLAAGSECSLRAGGREFLVQIERIIGTRLELRARERIPLGAPAVLVVYPWYLYERLKQELASLDERRFNLDLALALFGKRPPVSTERAFRSDHAELNESQRAAVALCNRNEVAFVWGPPGTGKTETLAHVVRELLAQGERVLLTSTTNAAIDQALRKLAAQQDLTGRFAAGQVVRLGHTDAETFGTRPSEILSRVDETTLRSITRWRERIKRHAQHAARLERAGEWLGRSRAPLQESLFGAPARPHDEEFASLGLVRFPRQAGADVQRDWLQRRRRRVARARELTALAIEQAQQRLRSRERAVVSDARVVIATLTNVYLSPFMQGQRFDAVIVEEAGMASLPALFFAASLARRRALMVGDPKQLPPIVSSREPYVRRVMGRSVFEVTVPEPTESRLVALLNTQYRMHPAIGALVSRLYYEGRLLNADNLAQRSSITSLAPYPQSPLVVVDTRGKTQCRGSKTSRSRSNEETARLSVQLARRAAQAGARDVAVITPYADQARAIKKAIGSDEARITCSTVHRFQGHERDVVIFDAVDTAPFEPGVLTSSTREAGAAKNLLNVSISRARGKLILIADVDYFIARAERGPLTALLEAALSCGVAIEFADALR